MQPPAIMDDDNHCLASPNKSILLEMFSDCQAHQPFCVGYSEALCSQSLIATLTTAEINLSPEFLMHTWISLEYQSQLGQLSHLTGEEMEA